MKEQLPPVSWLRTLPWFWFSGAFAALVLSVNASPWLDKAAELLQLDSGLDVAKAPVRIFFLVAFFAAAVRWMIDLLPHLQLLKDGKVSAGGHNPILKKALLARDQGQFEDAYALLEQELLHHPKDGELIDAFWDVACACGRCSQAAPTLVVAVQALMSENVEQAVNLWIEVSDRVEEPPADARILVKIGTHLRAAHHQRLSDQALYRAVDENTQGLSLGLVLKVVELTQESAPSIAVVAAKRALRFEALDDEKRDRMVYLLKDLQKSSSEQKEAKAEESESDQGGSPSWEKSDGIEIEPEEEVVPTAIVEKKREKGPEGLSMDLLEDLEREGLEGLDPELLEDVPDMAERFGPSFEAP
ncbi:MAG: hypothetical protein JRC77_07215, partial [Deltaproteobacteria bacterium]|nr:hypothetical protein [Deltaproteobacteria bacterium]